MPDNAVSAGVDAFAAIAQNLMHRSVVHQMKQAYRRDIKPTLVGKLKPGEGALLYLVTHEPKAVDLGLVPRQVIYKHLGVAGIGADPKILKRDFEKQPGMWASPANNLQKRVVRFIWLPSYQVHLW